MRSTNLFRLGLLTCLLVASILFVNTSPVDAKRKPGPTPTPTAAPTPTPTPVLTADISVAVTAPTSVGSNQPISYTITVTNNGPEAAPDVQFCSKLSVEGLALTGFDAGPFYVVIGSGGGRYPDCTIFGGLSSPLDPGMSVAMSYEIDTASYKIIDPNLKDITNTVDSSSTTTDPNSLNNTQVVVTTVGP